MSEDYDWPLIIALFIIGLVVLLINGLLLISMFQTKEWILGAIIVLVDFVLFMMFGGMLRGSRQ